MRAPGSKTHPPFLIEYYYERMARLPSKKRK